MLPALPFKVDCSKDEQINYSDSSNFACFSFPFLFQCFFAYLASSARGESHVKKKEISVNAKINT